MLYKITKLELLPKNNLFRLLSRFQVDFVISFFVTFCSLLNNFSRIQFWLMTPGWCSCQPGWQGDICERPCDPGYYGDNCQFKSECQNGARTQHITGACFCRPGWTGVLCENPCPTGNVFELDVIYNKKKQFRRLRTFGLELNEI